MWSKVIILCIVIHIMSYVIRVDGSMILHTPLSQFFLSCSSNCSDKSISFIFVICLLNFFWSAYIYAISYSLISTDFPSKIRISYVMLLILPSNSFHVMISFSLIVRRLHM